MYKIVTNYFSKHVVFNSFVHFFGGLGVGILLTFPVFLPHPMRWGIAFIVLAILGHIYAMQAKK